MKNQTLMQEQTIVKGIHILLRRCICVFHGKMKKKNSEIEMMGRNIYKINLICLYV